MNDYKAIFEDEMFEPIVTAIQEVSDAFKKLQNSKVKDRVILLLLKDATGLPMGDIENVLKAAASLKAKYLK
jgi:hypothetical protein